MLLTKESDYAIRIVRALKDGNKIRARDICEEEEIPEAFAYKILKNWNGQILFMYPEEPGAGACW